MDFIAKVEKKIGTPMCWARAVRRDDGVKKTTAMDLGMEGKGRGPCGRPEIEITPEHPGVLVIHDPQRKRLKIEGRIRRMHAPTQKTERSSPHQKT